MQQEGLTSNTTISVIERVFEAMLEGSWHVLCDTLSVLITCFVADFSNRSSVTYEPLYIVNLPTKDNQEEAVVGAMQTYQLCQMVSYSRGCLATLLTAAVRNSLRAREIGNIALRKYWMSSKRRPTSSYCSLSSSTSSSRNQSRE